MSPEWSVQSIGARIVTLWSYCEDEVLEHIRVDVEFGRASRDESIDEVCAIVN